MGSIEVVRLALKFRTTVLNEGFEDLTHEVDFFSKQDC